MRFDDRAESYDAHAAPQKRFAEALADVPEVSFSRRFRCEWGTWGIVAATLAAEWSLDVDLPPVTLDNSFVTDNPIEAIFGDLQGL